MPTDVCGSECALIRGRKPQGKNEKKSVSFFSVRQIQEKKRRKMTLLEDTQLKDSGGRSFLLGRDIYRHQYFDKGEIPYKGLLEEFDSSSCVQTDNQLLPKGFCHFFHILTS